MKRPKDFRIPGVGIFMVAFAFRLLHVWQMRETLFFSVLMGDDVEARRSFIVRNAKDVRFLDI